MALPSGWYWRRPFHVSAALVPLLPSLQEGGEGISAPSIDDLLVSELKSALAALYNGCPPNDDLRTISELVAAIEDVGAPDELSAVIGSYGDTLSDEEVLRYLTDWNDTGKVMDERP